MKKIDFPIEKKTEHFNIRVTPTKREKLLVLAEKNMRTASKEIECAIDAHIKRESKKI